MVAYLDNHGGVQVYSPVHVFSRCCKHSLVINGICFCSTVATFGHLMQMKTSVLLSKLSKSPTQSSATSSRTLGYSWYIFRSNCQMFMERHWSLEIHWVRQCLVNVTGTVNSVGYVSFFCEERPVTLGDIRCPFNVLSSKIILHRRSLDTFDWGSFITCRHPSICYCLFSSRPYDEFI